MTRLGLWHAREMVVPYALLEFETTEPFRDLVLRDGEGGAHVLLRHRGRPVGRIFLSRARDGSTVRAAAIEAAAAREAGKAIDEIVARDAFLARWGGPPEPAAPPDLAVAVCTRDRPAHLRRTLAALVALREAAPALEIIVVDSAPSDDAAAAVAATFQGVRHVIEPLPGLDTARNRAIAMTGRRWLAYVDDGAVIDRGWFDRLAEAIAASPAAAAFTGPVLPLDLSTEAQLRFERPGGFGKGFRPDRFGPERWGDPIHPAGPNRFGTGAVMVFDRSVLVALGGFDEALDTGPPLPGGGDLDIFYRVLRAGKRLVYVPGLVVHHEHRRDMTGLRRQCASTGRAIMAVRSKHVARDPAMRPQQRRLLLAWTKGAARRLLRALLGRGYHPPRLVLAEIAGSIVGVLGAYRRSEARVAALRRGRR
jgi:GT2 family glycosyltransferase